MRRGRIRGRRRDPKLERLSQVQLFAECNQRELSRIAALSVEIEVPEGRVLMKQGDPGNEAFFILEGRARAAIRGKGTATLGPGTCFGEMALLEDRGRRSATVSAETAMRLLVLSSREFASLLDDAPDVARKVLAAVATRLRDAERAQPHH
jgi:CRP/FNR family transcriptional regulator, cyclic AMP receptor protein